MQSGQWRAGSACRCLIHTAEPQEFFEKLDYTNERWLEMALFRDRRYPEGEAPRFERTARRTRSHVRQAIPKTTVHRRALSAITPTT